MFDNSDQAGRPLAKLRAALPLPARVTPELATTLQIKNTATETPTICSTTWIGYAGDEGGIMRRLDFGRGIETATFAPTTRLRFNARPPLARDITAYEKHRVKHLRQLPA